MTKLWRIWNKGSWPEFSIDVTGDHINEAINNFEKKQKKTSSMADFSQITKIELIGDTE